MYYLKISLDRIVVLQSTLVFRQKYASTNSNNPGSIKLC